LLSDRMAQASMHVQEGRDSHRTNPSDLTAPNHPQGMPYCAQAVRRWPRLLRGLNLQGDCLEAHSRKGMCSRVRANQCPTDHRGTRAGPVPEGRPKVRTWDGQQPEHFGVLPQPPLRPGQQGLPPCGLQAAGLGRKQGLQICWIRRDGMKMIQQSLIASSLHKK